MDQNPTAGGTDGGPNTAGQTEPSQNTEINAKDTNSASVYEVDSHYIDRDLKLPRDKRGHKGALIAGIIIGILLCIVAGVLIWFFACYNQPERVAFDAVEHFLKADNVVTTGEVKVTPDDTEESGIESVVIALDSSSSSLPSSSKVALTVKTNTEKEFKLDLGTVQMSDGVLYLQISRIMETVEQLNLDQSEREQLGDFFDTLELIDNEWWRISLDDFKDNLEETDPGAIDFWGDIYTCAVDLANGDLKQDIAKVYSDHRFLKVAAVKDVSRIDGLAGFQPASWHQLYEISLDNVALADFINALPETPAANAFYDCANEAIAKYYDDDSLEKFSAENFEEISASDIEWPEDLHVVLEISQFGHQLRSLHAYQSADDIDLSVDLEFKYQSVTVSAPESYRPISDLFDELASAFTELFEAYATIMNQGDDNFIGVLCPNGEVVDSVSQCNEWGGEI